MNVEQGRQWCWRFRGLEYLLPTNGQTSTIIPPSTSPRTQIQSHCSSNKPTPNVDSCHNISVPHTMPVLSIVVVAHIVLSNSFTAVSTSKLESRFSVATVWLLVVAPASLHVRSMFRRVTPPLLDHPRTSLRWVNQWLPADVEFGRTELVDPNHNGQLALDDTVVDTLCRSLHVVLDPTKDVLGGGVAKENNGLFVTLSGLAELVDLTV